MDAKTTRIDILGRELIVDELFSIIQKVSDRQWYCSFAIEGQWGVGKTFVLQELEQKLEIEMNESTMDNRYFVFHYNCWKYDYYEEPAIAIVSALKDKVEQEMATELQGRIKDSWNVAQNVVNEMAKEFVENKIGIDLVQIYQDIKEEGKERRDKEIEFDTLFSFNKTLEHLRNDIKQLADYKTIIIIVDELDRCMPSYSIKILERLHHLFEGIENIVLIIAVDSNQIEQSVKEIYGDSVDTERYLKKFISFKYRLDEGKTQDNVIEKFQDYFSLFDNYVDVKETLVEFFQLSNLDIRNIEKIMARCKLLHEVICDEIVGNSVLLYEVICSVLSYMAHNQKSGDKSYCTYGNDLYWIPDINLATYPVLDYFLEKDMLRFLKDMVKNAEGSTVFPMMDRRSINMYPEGICIGYMDIVLSKKKKLKFAIETDEIKRDIDICKEFTRLSKRIH